jgi:DNA-binding PadR family transcriptional regulator
VRHVANENNGPLSEAVLLILLSLAEGPRHGYAILKDVEALSNQRVKMSTGTLYGAIRRMLDDEWIRRFAEENASRDRQAYELTPGGQQVLAGEVARMKQLTRVAALRLREKEA